MLWEDEPHSFRKYRDEEKEKQLVYFNHQNVNSLCSRYHYVNSSCKFCVSIELQNTLHVFYFLNKT